MRGVNKLNLKKKDSNDCRLGEFIKKGSSNVKNESKNRKRTFYYNKYLNVIHYWYGEKDWYYETGLMGAITIDEIKYYNEDNEWIEITNKTEEFPPLIVQSFLFSEDNYKRCFKYNIDNGKIKITNEELQNEIDNYNLSDNHNDEIPGGPGGEQHIIYPGATDFKPS